MQSVFGGRHICAQASPQSLYLSVVHVEVLFDLILFSLKKALINVPHTGISLCFQHWYSLAMLNFPGYIVPEPRTSSNPVGLCTALCKGDCDNRCNFNISIFIFHLGCLLQQTL